MTTLIIDTETNGAPVPEVIELAYRDKETGETFCQRYQPETPSNYGALAVHHILPEELEGMPPSVDAKLPSCDYIIGHNIDYDWEALGSPPVKRICTLAIARKLYPEMDSHKLGAMYYRLCGIGDGTRERLQNAHSALVDVYLCFDVLGCMLADRAPQMELASDEELWAFSEKCRLPSFITFGKHKGLPIEKLPRDYVAWMRRQPDMDPYLMKAINAAHGGR